MGTNQWTWMSGSNLSAQPGNYGTQGIPSDIAVPSGRTGATLWIDLENTLWLFGGGNAEQNSK